MLVKDIMNFTRCRWCEVGEGFPGDHCFNCESSYPLPPEAVRSIPSAIRRLALLVAELEELFLNIGADDAAYAYWDWALELGSDGIVAVFSDALSGRGRWAEELSDDQEMLVKSILDRVADRQAVS